MNQEMRQTNITSSRHRPDNRPFLTNRTESQIKKTAIHYNPQLAYLAVSIDT